MPGHRNPLRMTGLLEHLSGHADNARANARDLSSSLAAFASEKMIDIKYVDLDVQFIGARGLPVMDVGGTADPYFVAKIDDQIRFISSVQVGTLNPVWNENWKVKNVPAHASLHVEVLDKDDGALTDDYVGKFTTSVSPGAKEVEISGKLLKRTRGSFWLKIDAQPASAPDPAACPYVFDGPLRFTRHFSPMVGRLTNLNDARLYSTWKLTLRGVPLFLKAEQPWNRAYPAAQRIFQGPSAVAVRSGIIAGHRLLYARSTRNGFGTIAGAADVLKLMHAGALPPGAVGNLRTVSPARGASPTRSASPGGGRFAHRVKPAVYTYVIAAEDDTLRFSETGAAFFVDFASKHALHAACAPTVRYSGEFHPRPVLPCGGGWAAFSDTMRDEDVHWELVVDNNSGTYAPDKALLPNLKALLEYNFPGLGVVVYDREDEALTKSRDACRAYATSFRGVGANQLEPHACEGEVPLAHRAAASIDGTGNESVATM